MVRGQEDEEEPKKEFRSTRQKVRRAGSFKWRRFQGRKIGGKSIWDIYCLSAK